jgi:SAM-dependent methyltransferase
MPSRGAEKRPNSGIGASAVVDWKKWGELDPLFGVASWAGKGRQDPAPWTDDEFYALGRQDWHDFWRVWQRYGVRPGVCAEIGSGAGRITCALPDAFSRVEAIDVSQGMIDYARARVRSERVTFHLNDGLRLPLGDATVDAVFSTHVFQHLDSLSQANAYFAEISRVMTDGATLMIHLPVYAWPLMARTLDRIYEVRRLLGDIRSRLVRPFVEHNRLRPRIRGLAFPIDFLFESLSELGFVDVEVTIMKVASNGVLHPFVLARRDRRLASPALSDPSG